LVALTANVVFFGAVVVHLVNSMEAGARCLSVQIEDFGFEFILSYDRIDFTPSEWKNAQELRPAITIKEVRAAYELLFENIAVRFSPRGSIESIDSQCNMLLRVSDGLRSKTDQLALVVLAGAGKKEGEGTAPPVAAKAEKAETGEMRAVSITETHGMTEV
jgi:hypothetical protein